MIRKTRMPTRSRPTDAQSVVPLLAAALPLLAVSLLLAALVAATPAPAQGFGWFGNLFGGVPRPAPGAPSYPGYGGNSGGTDGYAPRAPSENYYARPRHHAVRRKPVEQVQKDAAPKDKAPKNASVFVYVFGDSLGQMLGNGLDEALADRADVAVVQKARGSTGLVMGDYYNWPKAIDDLLAGHGAADKAEAGKPGKAGEGKAGEGKAGEGKAGEGKAGDKVASPGGSDTRTAESKESESKAGPPKSGKDPAAKDKIDVAVMMIGTNDRQPLLADGKTLQPGTAEWSAAYARRVLAIDEAFRAKGIPLIWVGVPITKDDNFADAMAGLNDIYRDAAAKTGATYVDTWEAFSDDNGDFAAYGPDVNGQTVRLRAADGILFTKAGARKLAHFVEVHVRRALEGKSPAPQLPTAEAPGEKGGHQAVAARPEAGPIHNLNDLPSATNGALATFEKRPAPETRATGSAGRDSLAARGPEPAPGAAPNLGASPVPAGRADDARWSGDPRADQ